MKQLSEQIYKILTHKKFRTGALPPDEIKYLILEKIENKVSSELPIKLFQFWGGCKNPNLSVDTAELCEAATLENLSRINEEVIQIYKPGLKIFISPGDGRVQRVNKIPTEKTRRYVEALADIANGYKGLFEIIPVSKLYDKYSEEFLTLLKEVEERIAKDVFEQADFLKLVLNARKNVFSKALASEEKIMERSKIAAKDYVVYRVVEEEAKIFREYKDCIRSFFIKYIPFYKKYIKDVSTTEPRLDCSLVFYTGGKGNITQPWQAVGIRNNDKVIFVSQSKKR
jgi:hypothetical protein